MGETTSSERQSSSGAASTSGGQRVEAPPRRLALRTWLIALVAAMICGLPALWLQQQQARQAAQVLVESQAKLGSEAMSHHFALRRDSRAAAFSSVAAKPRSQDSGRPVWTQLAQDARAAGADLAAVIDEGGALLAQDGVGAVALAGTTARGTVVPSGSLLAVGGQLVEAFRIPIAVDGKPGFLIAGCRILPETLRQDAEPLGIGVAIALDGTFVTNLPADALSSGRWGDDPRETLHNLTVRYHLRATPLSQGRLLIAVPLVGVQKWSNEQFQNALILVGLMLSAVLLLAVAVQIWVISPMQRLSDAATRVSGGAFARGRGMLKQFLERNDEFATVGRALEMAVQRLQSMLTTSQRLIEDIDTTVATIERVGSSLTSAAQTQDERSKEVAAAVIPIHRAIERLTRQMVEVRNAVVQISLAWSNADQAQSQVLAAARRADTLLHNPESTDARSYRTATVTQQVQLITQTLTEEREALNRIREQLTVLRATVDGAMDSVGSDDTSGASIGRSMNDISRLARQQTSDSDALKATVEHLRKDSEKLSLLIQAIQSRSSEDLATSSGTWGIGSRSRTTSDRVTRGSMSSAPPSGSRSLTGTSSLALRPVAMGPLPSSKLSGPTASTSGERKVGQPSSAHSPRASISGSSPSIKPVGSNSSPSNRPVVLNNEARTSGAFSLSGYKASSKPPTDSGPKSGD